MGYNSVITGRKIEDVVQKSILKDNTEEYIPQGDYNPATKKFVEDKIKESIDSIEPGNLKWIDVQ